MTQNDLPKETTSLSSTPAAELNNEKKMPESDQDLEKSVRADQVMDLLSKGLNQAEVASTLGISQPTVSRLKTGYLADRLKLRIDEQNEILEHGAKQEIRSNLIYKALFRTIDDETTDNKTRLSAIKQLTQKEIGLMYREGMRDQTAVRSKDWGLDIGMN